MELTQLKELKATGDKGAVRRNNDRRKGAMNFSHFRLASIKGSEGMTKLTRTEGPAEITFIKSFHSRKQSEFNEMNGLKRRCKRAPEFVSLLQFQLKLLNEWGNIITVAEFTVINEE